MISRHLFVAVAVFGLAAVSATALGVELGNGSRVRGEVTSSESYRVVLPEGARVKARIKLDRGARSKDRPPFSADLTLVDGGRVADAQQRTGSRRLVLRGRIDTSGEHDLTVRSNGGVEAGYDLRLRWRAPRRTKQKVTLGPQPVEAPFGVAGGGTFDVQVKGGGVIERVRSADGSVVVYERGDAPGESRLRGLEAGAGGAFIVECSGEDGSSARVVVRRRSMPRSRGVIDLTSETVLRGADVTGSVIDGGVGGTVAAPLSDTRIGGASILIPPGALPSAATIYLAEAPPLELPGLGNLTPTGPTVAFGPPGTTFREPARATVPFDPGPYGGDFSDFRLFLVSADGSRTEFGEDDVVIDEANGLVTFPVSHFSAARPFVARQFTLVPGDPPPWEEASGNLPFGSTPASFDFDASRAVFGAGGEDDDAAWRLRDRLGGVHVFDRVDDEWVERFRLGAPTNTTRLGFGATVALSGDTLAVGEPYENPFFFTAGGAVHVFERDGAGYSLAQTLFPDDRFFGDNHGVVLALDGDVLVVTADERRTNANGDFGHTETGVVYVYERVATEWVQTATLRDTPAEEQGFGDALALAGGRLFVRSPKLSGDEVVVYADRGSGWEEVDRIEAPGASESDGFGSFVAADADRFVTSGGGFGLVYSIDGLDRLTLEQTLTGFAGGEQAELVRPAVEGERIVLSATVPDVVVGGGERPGLLVFDFDADDGRFVQRGVVLASAAGPAMIPVPRLAAGRIGTPAGGGALIFEEVEAEEAP